MQAAPGPYQWLQPQAVPDERVPHSSLMRSNEDVKEAGMPKRSPSQHVPRDMQARFEEITRLTDAFCQTYLNDEYRQLCRELTATLCRKRPSPLVRGKATTWACGIIHAASHGELSFRFLTDPPHCGKPNLGVLRAEFEYHAGQIQADPRPVGHVSDGSRLVDPLDGRPEPADLDARASMASSSMCATHHVRSRKKHSAKD